MLRLAQQTINIFVTPANNMLTFIQTLKTRNEVLFYFGIICFAFAMLCLLLTRITTTQVFNVSAWYKPFKFAFSTFLYAWAMAWFIHYLSNFNSTMFNYTTIILLGFEIIYIAIQAAKGQLSHFNLSTSFYTTMYSLMALAATLVTLYTAYVCVLFFTQNFPHLPQYYLWGIRLGLLLFVVFAFEGFIMGSRLTHTIGGADGGPGIPLLNWSTKFGDPRVAHFIGMHALQVLPLLSYFVLKNNKAVIFASFIYGLLACFVLLQALQGRPLFKSKKESTELNRSN